jgi:hypothetical protein
MDPYRCNQRWQHKKNDLPTLPDDAHPVLPFQDIYHDEPPLF